MLAVILLSGASAAWFGFASGTPATASSSTARPPEVTATPASLRRSGADEVVVPKDVAARVGLRTATASAPTKPRTLPPFAGTLAVDSNTLVRVYSRFPGEVVTLGTTTEPITSALPGDSPAPGDRPLRVGDRVKKGQILAVVWSSVLGEKKSELVDALSKKRRDEEVLDSLRQTEKSGAVPARSILDAERDVEADRVAVQRAERTLRSWRLTEPEIAAVRAEAEKLARPGAPRPDPAEWARAEVKAPQDGVIVERNTNASTIVDTTSVLFQVADLSKLAVWVHVYEEDLPLLQGLPTPVGWKVSLLSRPETVFPGTLGGIGAVIDPNQHTALVTGTVDNPRGELRAGMAVTATVELPPPAGEVEIPAEALVEDGRESVVFVRSPADPTVVTRHRVRVARRFRDVVYLAADPAGVQPGDVVITAGSLLLNGAMNELPANHP